MRKKHFENRSHKFQVKMHYDSFRETHVNLQVQQSPRPLCQNLLFRGFCEFGVHCRFSHYLQDLPASVPPTHTFKSSELPPSLAQPPEHGYDPEEVNKAQWD